GRDRLRPAARPAHRPRQHRDQGDQGNCPAGGGVQRIPSLAESPSNQRRRLKTEGSPDPAQGGSLWFYVLVDMEEIVRIILPLDLNQLVVILTVVDLNLVVIVVLH